jgi:hypothetical protein
MRKRKKVFWKPDIGWVYRFRGEIRGPFESAAKAGIEMNREAFVFRSVARAEDHTSMTFADRNLEDWRSFRGDRK